MSNAINWNASIPFPSDSCFINRVLSASFGPSNSSGNPMITLEMEVVSPTTYMVGEQEVNIAGVKTKNYFTTKVIGDDAKTENCKARVFVSTNPDQPSLFEKFELDGSKENPENPNVQQLVGKLVMTQMSSEADEQRKTPTAEQIAKAKKAGTRPVGDVMKNPKTGKAMCKYWPKVEEIFGLATAPSGL